MAIAKCPECQEEVLVPSASEEATVQCPLCDAEYELSVIKELLPPELRIVSDPGAVNESELKLAPQNVESASHAAFAFEEESAPTRSISERAATRQSSGGSSIKTMIQVFLGGALALPLAQLVLWHVPDEPRDPVGLGKKIYAEESLGFLRVIVPQALNENVVQEDETNEESAQEDEHLPLTNPLQQGTGFNVGPMDEVQLGGSDVGNPFGTATDTDNDQNPTIDEIAAQAKPPRPAPFSPTEYVRESFVFQTLVIDNMFEQARDSLKQWDDLKEDASENLRQIERKELFLSLGQLASGITYQDPDMSESFDGVSRAYSFFEELSGRREIMALMNEEFERGLNTRQSAREGVLFTARSVGKEETISGYRRLTLQLDGTQLELPLLYSPEIARPVGEDMSSLVLGSLIRRPRRDVRNYLGSEELVIVFGAAVELAASPQ